MTDPHRITITICGDGGCGKSSITLRLVRSQWTHDYDPTIEDSYTVSRTVDGQTYHLCLTDTAGQEEYRGMWAASSNLHSDAFLLVYDTTSRDSLSQLAYFDDLIDIEAEARLDCLRAAAAKQAIGSGSRRHKTAASASASSGGGGAIAALNSFVRPVKIVAGNKCDLQENRQVPAREGLEWARRRGCGFMETSARNMVNIEETFALIVRRVVAARKLAASASLHNSSGDLTDDCDYDGVGRGYATRRAVTAPLSPIIKSQEKELALATLPGYREGGSSWLRRVLKGCKCW